MRNQGIARRVKVDKRPGIYYRIGGNGKRRYEITFLDEQDVRRWQVVDGNLEDAAAELEEKRRRRRAEEPVAPDKVTFADFAEGWLAGRVNLRPGTRELYRIQLDSHILPQLGQRYVHTVRADDVTSLIAEMHGGWHYRKDENGRIVRIQRAKPYSGHTIRGVVKLVGSIMKTAVKRRLVAQNPMAMLEDGEQPVVEEREMRILTTDEISLLLAKATKAWRPLLAAAVFTGLRQSELLGLVWGDVDLDVGVIHVRKQLDRTGKRVALKTKNARRDVYVFDELVLQLREHRQQAFAKGRARPEDPVFASIVGSPLGHRNVVRRGLEPALKAADLDGKGFRWHDMRHVFASLLIAQGRNVLFISRQLGHSSATLTLNTYGHLFDQHEHADAMRAGLESQFGDTLRAAFDEDARRPTGDQRPRWSAAGERGNVAKLR